MTQRQDDHSKLSLSRVLIKMKRKIDLVEEEEDHEAGVNMKKAKVLVMKARMKNQE